MSDTSRDKRAAKLKLFNEAWHKANPERGNSNLWAKDLCAAGMRPDEIRTVFPRGAGKHRACAMKSYRRAVKTAIASHRFDRIPNLKTMFDPWSWD